MKILITGSSGYIGMNLIKYIMMVKNTNVMLCDKVNGELVEELDNLDGITHIVHLAAISAIKDCNDNPIQAVNDNILATLHLFNLASNRAIPIIFASSGSAQSPMDNLYAMSKFICEQEAMKLNNYGSNIKVLRFANVYGGIHYFGNKSSVVARFNEDDPLIVNGDGNQTRDFIHVDDICRCIWLAMKNREVINKPLGVGSGVNTSVLDLAKMFNKKITFDTDSTAVGADESPAEVETSKIYLGFESSTVLKEYVHYISL